MPGNRHRLAKPERAAKENREIKAEKRVGHIAAGGAVHDESAERRHQETKVETAAPLTRRDPGFAGQENGCHETEVRGVEDVLAVPADDELTGNRDAGCDERHGQEVGSQKQTLRRGSR